MNRGVAHKILIGLAGAMLGLAPASAVAEEWALDLDALHSAGLQLYNEYVPEEWRDDDALPSPHEWRQFWHSIERALQSHQLIDLAWIRPEAEIALQILEHVPLAAPYADWLAQRMDYINAAWNVLHDYSPSTVRPTPATPRTRPLQPHSPRPPVQVPPHEDKRLRETARSTEKWTQQLQDRPAPANARQWVPELKEIFKNEGIPPELVWLAEVESSFNPAARSPAGATGLYQFMPATAQRFGLALTPQDDRLDPRKSARAAAQYLKILYRRFDNWPLALAAYNAGEGRIGRLLREHDGLNFEDIVEHLPVETQMYVPKIDAVLALREGRDLSQI